MTLMQLIEIIEAQNRVIEQLAKENAEQQRLDEIKTVKEAKKAELKEKSFSKLTAKERTPCWRRSPKCWG